jgi:hypothetical protein
LLSATRGLRAADQHSNIILCVTKEPCGLDETGRFGDETPP